MAYPGNIPALGPLSNYGDILDYFKESHYDWILYGTDREDYETDYWAAFRTYINANNPAVPSTMSGFESILSGLSPSFPKADETLYVWAFDEPQSGWSKRMVNDWGIIKQIEYALYDDAGSRRSEFSSSTYLNSIGNWKHMKLSLLRFALTRFEEYGSCYVDVAKNPPPTNPVDNVSARTFNWTNAPGYSTLSSYEYQYGYAGWNTVTSKPITVPTSQRVSEGALQVRVKGTGYQQPSDPVTNNEEYPEIFTLITRSTRKTSGACTVTYSARTLYFRQSEFNNLNAVPEYTDPPTVGPSIRVYKDNELTEPADQGWYKFVDLNNLYKSFYISYTEEASIIIGYQQCSAPDPTFASIVFDSYDETLRDVCSLSNQRTRYILTGPPEHPDFGKIFRFQSTSTYTEDGFYTRTVGGERLIMDIEDGVMTETGLTC